MKKGQSFDPQVGDVVRVDGDPKPWKVLGKTPDGELSLESLHSYVRIIWDGVHEFRAARAGVFG